MTTPTYIFGQNVRILSDNSIKDRVGFVEHPDQFDQGMPSPYCTMRVCLNDGVRVLVLHKDVQAVDAEAGAG